MKRVLTLEIFAMAKMEREGIERDLAHQSEGRAPTNTPPGMTIAAAQAHEAFLRDLPNLLETHGGQWVAYAGRERLGFGKTQRELVHKVQANGLTLDDFIVVAVEPDPE